MEDLQPEEHEVLVDAEVVHLVPVQVEDVDESLEPGKLPFLRHVLAQIGENVRDLLSHLSLVGELVAVPKNCILV